MTLKAAGAERMGIVGSRPTASASGVRIAASLLALLGCNKAVPDSDFKSAVSVELYDCGPGEPKCPGPDRLRFSLDATKFRRAVASAVFEDSRPMSKGSFLIRATLADGRTLDLKAFYGGRRLQQIGGRGSWVFREDRDTGFPGFLNEVHHNLVIPARSARNAAFVSSPAAPGDGGQSADAAHPGVVPDSDARSRRRPTH